MSVLGVGVTLRKWAGGNDKIYVPERGGAQIMVKGYIFQYPSSG
jgi:hypothetical protein